MRVTQTSMPAPPESPDAPPPYNLTSSPEYQESLAFMVDVGFTDQALNLRALVLHDGNRNKALRWLRNQSPRSTAESSSTGSVPPPPPPPPPAPPVDQRAAQRAAAEAETDRIVAETQAEAARSLAKPAPVPLPPYQEPPPPPPPTLPSDAPPPPSGSQEMPFDGTLSTTFEGYFIAAELEKQIVESLESQVSDGGNRAVVARKLVSHNFTLSFLNDAQLPRHLYREALQSLCDMDFYDRMNSERVLNYHEGMDKLVPLTIRGDGNCLLNSVCAAMWGIQDRKRTVRTVMLHGLLDDEAWHLKDRWQQCEARAEVAIGEQACDTAAELQEWIGSVHDRLAGEYDMQLQWAEQPSASLCSLHVFVLCNVLCRPIIVYGPKTVGLHDDFDQPNEMVGIYLPLLWSPEDAANAAVKEPICLAYSDGHFWALVPLDAVNAAKVPLVDSDGCPLPVKCLLAGEDRDAQIQQWMDCGGLAQSDDQPELPFAFTSNYNPHPQLGSLVQAFVQRVLGQA